MPLLQGKLLNNQPYENSIITDILSQAFFHGANAFATSHIQGFEVEWAGEVCQELPQSMVALAATAVSYSTACITEELT